MPRLLFLCSVLLCCAGSMAPGEEIVASDCRVDLQIAGTAPKPERALLKEWVERSARVIALYYGKFPVPKFVLRVSSVAGREVSHGQTFGYDGNVVTAEVGRSITAADLQRDWVLPHEMLHLGFPSLPEKNHWLEEGLATYLEPTARVRAGLLSAEEAWSDLVENLPEGLPKKGDRGLDGTPTWGRTYYGGALFALRADVEIRRRTNNQRGLEHVLRAIVATGGTVEHEWKIDRVIAVGDAATGVPVLRELYRELKDHPVQTDLPALWKQLGVVPAGHTVKFDDTAPLAAVRKAITAR